MQSLQSVHSALQCKKCAKKSVQHSKCGCAVLSVDGGKEPSIISQFQRYVYLCVFICVCIYVFVYLCAFALCTVECGGRYGAINNKPI